jgi:iron complex outermembrane receptor protein
MNYCRKIKFKNTLQSVCIAGLLLAFSGSSLMASHTVPLPVTEPVTEEGNQQVSGKLSGVVIDNTGSPLDGVNIQVKKTTIGTISDADGKFTLSGLTKGAVVSFSYIGFVAQEITYTGQATLTVTLLEDSQLLDEVVVTALGVKREAKSLGYAVSTIKGDDITVAGITANPLSAIYGKAAGVGLMASASGPTGGINIKIRGASQLESSSTTRPLFVVDGVPIYDTESSMASRNYDPFNSFDYGSGINDINSEDIESMEILKGAKASVLYGSAGANGVVLITTKKGAGTRGLGVTVSFNHTFEEPVNFIEWQNSYGAGSNEYQLAANDNKLVLDYRNFGAKFDNREITYWDDSKRKYQAYPSNYDDIFHSGSTNSVQFAIAGGNEKGNMRLSYTNYKFDGIVDNHWQQKHTFSYAGQMNVSQFAKMELTANLYKIETQNRYPNISSLMSVGYNRDNDYQTIASKYVTEDGYRATLENIPAAQSRLASLLWHQNYNTNLDDKLHMISSVRNTFQFHPLVNIVTLAGLDYTQTDYSRKEKVTAIDPTVEGGKYRFDTDQHFIYNLQANLNYDQSFVDDKLRVTAFVGTEYRSTNYYNIYASTYGNLSYPDWYSLNNVSSFPGFGERDKVLGHGRAYEALYSTYASATISWKDRHYLELQARNDWSSTLPKDNNSYFYPGISYNWNFSEDFKIPYLNFGKVRLSFADVGRPATRYFALSQYNLSTISGTGGAQSVDPPGELFSGEIKPERKREFEFGTNLRFLPQNRIEVDFSYYNGVTYNQIMGIPLTSTTGYSRIKINAGRVRNSGYELLLKGAPVVHKDYRWDISLTLAHQYSEVEELYDNITRHVLYQGGTNGGWAVVAETGKRSGEILVYDYLKAPDGQKIVDNNGLYQPDYTGGYKSIGNVNPSLIGGFATDFYYKNFNMHVGFDYSYGSKLVSISNYYLLSTGSVKATLANRDEASGGLPYYIDADGKRIRLNSHSDPAPAGAQNDLVYHDGMILPGVMVNENNQHVTNDKVVSVASYWGMLNQDMQQFLQPDYIYDNNYVKLREIALQYTIPKAITEKLKLQKVMLSLTGRNLLYLYKSIPNIDSESVQGTNSYYEYSIFPMHRSWGFGLNVSF